MIHTTNAKRIDWDSLPTLSEAQCCDLKIDTGDMRYWVCRGGSEYFGDDISMMTIEKLDDGRWVYVQEDGEDQSHVPARDVEIPDYIIPDVS